MAAEYICHGCNQKKSPPWVFECNKCGKILCQSCKGGSSACKDSKKGTSGCSGRLEKRE